MYNGYNTLFEFRTCDDNSKVRFSINCIVQIYTCDKADQKTVLEVLNSLICKVRMTLS